jgi:phospholipase C
VTRGEALIKSTYEAIRNSPVWPDSLLIVTWDENGGFYDHAIPPPAVDPADTAPNAKYNQNGFTFAQYGPRVPAIVVSPLIPRNRIDHRLYDHASIPAAVEALFGLNPLTQRDAKANRPDKLVSLGTPRDTPATLPAVAIPAPAAAAPVSRAMDSADDGNLPGIMQSAMRQDLEISPQQRPAILSRVASIRTRADAMQYLQEVQQKVAPLRR